MKSQLLLISCFVLSIFISGCSSQKRENDQTTTNNKKNLQSILIDKPYCDLGGKQEHIMQILTNFNDQIMVKRIGYEWNRISEIIKMNELKKHCEDHISKNNGQSVFVIRYYQKNNATELILEQVKSVYQSLNILENDWKICYVSHDENINQPPPPPPHQTTVIGIVDDEEEIEDEKESDTNIELVKDDDIPFMIVENMPALGPCINMRGDERNQCTQGEIIKYVSKNTKYPEMAKDAGIQGTVFVYFVVAKNGNVKDVRILREIHPQLDKEAKRVVESLPKFDPGKQRGKNVSVQYTIPVKFIIR